MAHARLGPSNHRWPVCAGSVREEAEYPDVAGAAAVDGTGSHLLLELCMQNNCRAEAYDGHIVGANHPDNPLGWMVSLERIKRVQECLDYVARRVSELKMDYPYSEIVVESESQSNPGEKYGRSDWWGTVDITITVTYNGAIQFVEVIDYKDGRGYVNCVGNSQLVSYMTGKLPQGGENIPVRMTIVQPKTDPSVRYCNTYSNQIAIEANMLAEAAARTDDPDAPLTHGEHCQWCKHKPNCNAKGYSSLGVMKMTTEDIAATGGSSLFELVNEMLGDITAVSADKLVQLADAREGIIAVFDKVEAEMQRRIESGDTIEGYAMLPGNGSNQWSVEEEEIVKMLKARRLTNDIIYPKKLISPAQVLKLDKLTKEQKEKIQTQYIKSIPSDKLKLSKVRQQRKTADVAELFAGVAQQPSFL